MERRYAAAALHAFGASCFRAVGVASAHADCIASVLVQADLRGIASHGVTRIPIYAERLRRGAVNPRPEPWVVSEAAAALVLDGDNGPGPVVSDMANRLAMERAARSGIGLVTVRNSNHNGICSAYTMQAAQAGMIGIAATNAAKSMAVAGASEPVIGTNPLSIAVPSATGAPLVLDMATSVVARGKIVEAAKRGESIPDGWALDAQGLPTNDAQEAEQGVILPFGGAKGSGLAVMIEMLCGVLSGGVFGPQIRNMYTDFTHPQGVGHLFLVIAPQALGDTNAAARVDALAAMLRAARPAAGVDAILLPGEPEARREALGRAQGIALPDNVVRDLQQVAQELGVPLLEDAAASSLAG